MVHSLKEAETRETLRRCHADQQREALLPAAWTKPPANSYNVFLLSNLEAAWDEGHCILALGPVGGPLQTYSYYRHSSQLEAPRAYRHLQPHHLQLPHLLRRGAGGRRHPPAHGKRPRAAHHRPQGRL